MSRFCVATRNFPQKKNQRSNGCVFLIEDYVQFLDRENFSPCRHPQEMKLFPSLEENSIEGLDWVWENRDEEELKSEAARCTGHYAVCDASRKKKNGDCWFAVRAFTPRYDKELSMLADSSEFESRLRALAGRLGDKVSEATFLVENFPKGCAGDAIKFLTQDLTSYVETYVRVGDMLSGNALSLKGECAL